MICTFQVVHCLFVFEKSRNKCLEIYKLDPAHFIFGPELAWQVALEKAKAKLVLLTKIDMSFML